MNKIIWTIWFQGEESAPDLVRRCLKSWRDKNPDWQVRCLTATDISKYINIGRLVDLSWQQITAASLSDIARILLLQEYGGVWVDATLYCNRPLNEWLADAMPSGFFAFAKPEPDRLLSSWFLAAECGNPIIAAWASAVSSYWRGRASTDEYYWFHDLFGSLVSTDDRVATCWGATPRYSADPCHAIQNLGFSSKATATAPLVDWMSPVFKLTYRYNPEEVGDDSLLARVIGGGVARAASNVVDQPLRNPIRWVQKRLRRWLARRFPKAAFGMERRGRAAPIIASLKVVTDNLGDHVQIIACNDLLARFGFTPAAWVDRDNEIKSAPSLAPLPRPVHIVLNGWFKWNGAEWPPNEKLEPFFIGFHLRHLQAPELLQPSSIKYFMRHQPIGCRDRSTAALLESYGVETYVSGCLSLTFHRRLEVEVEDRQNFVVSRDERLLKAVGDTLGPCEFVNHYTGSSDFSENMNSAALLLDRYRRRAGLIVTSLLHCALPAIAMGIPTIVVYPANSEAGHISDRERFSLLGEFVPIYSMDDIKQGRVNWKPAVPDVSSYKLLLIERFASFACDVGAPPVPPVGPIAPAHLLPPGRRAPLLAGV